MSFTILFLGSSLNSEKVVKYWDVKRADLILKDFSPKVIERILRIPILSLKTCEDGATH